MRRAVIRSDGTPEGGLGHLIRAVSVAEAARAAGWHVVVAGDVTSPFARELLAASDIGLVPAPDDLGVLAAEQSADLVHVDDYGVGPGAYEQVRAAGALLSSMEDGTFGRRRADLVVDSAMGAESPGSPSTARPDDGSGLVLRGIAYAPMRAGVRAARAAREAAGARPRSSVDVLVVMGGSDATGAAATVAAACRAAPGVGQVTVVAPPGRWSAVREAAGVEGVALVEPAADFLDRAARADLVVSTASTTAWELACIGVPMVLVVVVENQQHVYDAVLGRGAARGLGSIEQVRAAPDAASDHLAAAAADLLRGASWAAAAGEMVDGLGAGRIVAAWDRLLDDRAARR